uniref:CX domain-containing protein n=1 Tax=Steinernema glaseri TaxID=37863 RepID=A0A1I7Y9C3_9BILA
MLSVLLVALLSAANALKANEMICWDHAPTVETNVLLHNIVTKGVERFQAGKVIDATDTDNKQYRYSLQKPTYNEGYEQLFEYSFDPSKLFQAKGKFMGYYEYDRLYTIYFVCPRNTVQCGLFCCPSSTVQQQIIAASYFTDSSDMRRIDTQTTVTIGRVTYALIRSDQRCEYKLQWSEELHREVRLDSGKPISSVYFDCAPDEYCCQLGCRRNASAVHVEYARVQAPSSLRADSASIFHAIPRHLLFVVGTSVVLTIILVGAIKGMWKRAKNERRSQKPEEV